MLLEQEHFSKIPIGVASGKMLFISSEEIIAFKSNVKTKCFIVKQVQ